MPKKPAAKTTTVRIIETPAKPITPSSPPTTFRKAAREVQQTATVKHPDGTTSKVGVLKLTEKQKRTITTMQRQTRRK